MTYVLRTTLLLLSLALTAVASALFIRFAAPDGWNIFDNLRLALTAICVFWLSWGALGALFGIVGPAWRRHSVTPPKLGSPSCRTAVLMPIYNEDPRLTFGRIAAISRGLSARHVHGRFDLFLLSDTTSLEIATEEVLWRERLIAACPDGAEHIFYRRRPQNHGRKAGNIADFIRRSGAAYDYAIVLDADSLMEPETLVEMVARMESEPRLGLLQTLPRIIGARSVFGRAMQFSAAYYSPVHARGVALLQGGEGPFWGHNAIFRIPAFAESCGLPELTGKPPFGGQILSHDFVEAALLARNNWKVELHPDLRGSYEEAPENAVAYARRDRRWCQGNLQHHRLLLGTRRLPSWNRMTLMQGIMAYLLSPVWLALLLVSAIASAAPRQYYFDYFYYVPNSDAAASGIALVAIIAALLLLPKLLTLPRGLADGDNRGFGGTLSAAGSVIAEIVFSSLLAPAMLLFQARSVVQVLMGLDGGWPPSNRTDGQLSLRDAWAASYWMTLIGGAALAAVLAFMPRELPWASLVITPMIAGPLIIAATSQAPRAFARLWRTPEEQTVPPIVQQWHAILAEWHAEPVETMAEEVFKLDVAADART